MPKLIRHYAYYRRVLQAARSADVILALDPVSVGLPAMVAAKKVRKPFVVKIVGDYAWEQGRQRFGVIQDLDEFVKTKSVSFPVRILRRIQTHVARSATRIIVPSEYLKGIVTAWGIQSQDIEVIYNAVSLEMLGRSPTDVTALKRPLVVSAGRLVPWKHMNGVIRAVAQLRTEGITASLAIVGGGPERASLMRTAQKKLGSACILTGALSHRDTLAVMKSADVFVLNSSYEGLSHVLIEALALGVPTIATRVGGNPEVVTDDENGLLVSVGDTHLLARTIGTLLADKNLSARLSAGAKISSQRFSTETLLSETAALLKNL